MLATFHRFYVFRYVQNFRNMSAPRYLLRKIDCNQEAVRSVRYNVDGNYCLTCGSDKSIKLWNPVSGVLIKTYSGIGNEVLDVASSSDNSQFAAGGLDKCVSVFDVESGKTLRKYRTHGAKVNCLCYNEESNVLFSGSMDCTVQAFDVRTRSEKAIQVMNEASDAILSIDINGHEVAVGSADAHFRTYNLKDGVMTEDFMGEAVTSASFTPDAMCVLVSTMDSNLRLIDKASGKMLASYTGHVNRDYVVRSCVLASINEVVTGSEDGNLYVYNLIDSSVIARLPHKHSVVHSVTAHPKEQQMISACGSLIYVWTNQKEIEEE